MALIRDGAFVADDWKGELLSLDELNERERIEGIVGVQLEPDQPPSAISVSLDALALVAINFPVFTDGRGFSYARELRERGYAGEIRAVGNFIPDQLHYLKRCGFNAFELSDDVREEDALRCLAAFSDGYQADAIGQTPLFRRR